MANSLKTKRIYDAYEEDDGFRILTDRLWPRGIKKENAHLDAWLKEIAPSNELRKMYHADYDYESFKRAYLTELEQNPEINAFCTLIAEHLKKENVTLLTASRDMDHCNLSVLMEYLRKINMLVDTNRVK